VQQEYGLKQLFRKLEFSLRYLQVFTVFTVAVAKVFPPPVWSQPGTNTSTPHTRAAKPG
jgi:hypothetical protein